MIGISRALRVRWQIIWWIQYLSISANYLEISRAVVYQPSESLNATYKIYNWSTHTNVSRLYIRRTNQNTRSILQSGLKCYKSRYAMILQVGCCDLPMSEVFLKRHLKCWIVMLCIHDRKLNNDSESHGSQRGYIWMLVSRLDSRYLVVPSEISDVGMINLLEHVRTLMW